MSQETSLIAGSYRCADLMLRTRRGRSPSVPSYLPARFEITCLLGRSAPATNAVKLNPETKNQIDAYPVNGSGLTRVLIADDLPLIREGLRGLLSRNQHLELVAEAMDGRDAVDLCEQHQPDVAVIEADLSRLNGVDAVDQIHKHCPKTRLIVLSSRSDGDLVARAIRAGASGFVLKENSADELVQAIFQVASGGVFLSPQVVQVVVEQLVRHGDVPLKKQRLEVLTPREREVAQLLSEGYTPRQIARQFHVSTKTIDTHRYQILKKLNLKNTAELTRLALQEGLTRLDA